MLNQIEWKDNTLVVACMDLDEPTVTDEDDLLTTIIEKLQAKSNRFKDIYDIELKEEADEQMEYSRLATITNDSELKDLILKSSESETENPYQVFRFRVGAPSLNINIMRLTKYYVDIKVFSGNYDHEDEDDQDDIMEVERDYYEYCESIPGVKLNKDGGWLSLAAGKFNSNRSDTESSTDYSDDEEYAEDTDVRDVLFGIDNEVSETEESHSEDEEDEEDEDDRDVLFDTDNEVSETEESHSEHERVQKKKYDEDDSCASMSEFSPVDESFDEDSDIEDQDSDQPDDTSEYEDQDSDHFDDANGYEDQDSDQLDDTSGQEGQDSDQLGDNSEDEDQDSDQLGETSEYEDPEYEEFKHSKSGN
ncbi:hypothetical protein H4219_004608 [Mycoemilia scoparia]|uniref:Uncharacterized protein n=1 Tax=Mycoemilia scoparia TaxID=417184 RepID=A0A9W8DMK4_9FUNG|nr:hypothetical protein H4219_004608 [Mycoemilia scoparia]